MPLLDVVLQFFPKPSHMLVPATEVLEAARAEIASEVDHLPLIAAHLGQITTQFTTDQS